MKNHLQAVLLFLFVCSAIACQPETINPEAATSIYRRPALTTDNSPKPVGIVEKEGVLLYSSKLNKRNEKKIIKKNSQP